MDVDMKPTGGRRCRELDQAWGSQGSRVTIPTEGCDPTPRFAPVVSAMRAARLAGWVARQRPKALRRSLLAPKFSRPARQGHAILDGLNAPQRRLHRG